ncbi:MAG: Uma2 family endonuclease [Planctomycetaceae bacterium]|nr:Uma2 family endonuclease [Planctomycetaceae bacterium]
MVMLIAEPDVEHRLIAQRQADGIDQHDEVWEGVYFVSPIANNEHQGLTSGLVGVMQFVVDWKGLGRSFPGVNVTDQEIDWTKNYRVPDVAVFLNGNHAEDRQTHFLGGPDFAVEIVSSGDRSLEKLPFYSQVGVRELLIIDRNPWALELYRRGEGELALLGHSTIEHPQMLPSLVLPLKFRLVTGIARPQIEISHNDGKQQWLI